MKTIDEKLRNRPQWVCHNSNKIPLQPSGIPAKTNDPTTWSTYDQVWKAVQEDTTKAITGIGYVFTPDDPFIGIDLDGCLSDDQQLVPAAKEIVNWCNSYTEVSVSGTGLHIIVEGTLPKHISNKIDMHQSGFKALEVYDCGRYFTMTGNHFGPVKTIREVNISELPIPKSGKVTDRVVGQLSNKSLAPLIEKIKTGNDGKLFIALYDHGDLSHYQGDQSRADMGLINILSKWANFDMELIDQLFRSSSLMRPKWDETHSSDGTTYGQMTIQKVLSSKQIYNKREFEGYLRYHYNFRYNTVLGRTEIQLEGEWKQLDDYLLNSIHRRMVNDGAKISIQKLHGLLNSDFVAQYDPIVQYFKSLPEWDGTDYIKELANQVKASDQAYWEFCFRKWLVAMVASGINKSVVNHCVLILQGGQGIGKTTYLLGLVPATLGEYIYSGTLNPTDKDTMIHLSESLLINLDELETLTKYKEGALKEIITKSEIRVRRPYGRFSEKLTRRASLCGSVNDSAVLKDPTGSRRFLIHNIKSINYNHGIDIDKVYAQAFHLLSQDFKYWFDNDDIKQIHSKNLQFQNMSVEEELLLDHFKKADSNSNYSKKLTATKILEEVHYGRLPSNVHSAKIRMGQALAKHNFNFVINRGSKLWLVERNNSMNQTRRKALLE